VKKTLLLAELFLVLAALGCGAPDLDTVEGAPETLQTAEEALTAANCTQLASTGVSASGSEASNPPGNTLDDLLTTRWSNFGKGSWIDYDLGTSKSLSGVTIAWHEGNLRKSNFVVSTSFPSVRTWQLFTQWHHEGGSGSPPLEFYVYGEELRLNIGGDPGVIVWKAPLVRGQWQDFILHVKGSPDATVGFVELYHQGQLVLPKRHIATMFPGMLNYLKVGLYRSDTVSRMGVVYHDGWVMARGLADVL